MGARSTKRTLVKRITSLNLYVDQEVQIRALMEASGSQKEAPLVRQLVDEALSARRRKSVQRTEAEPPPATQDISQTLQTIQTLLLRMIGQGQTSFRIQSVSLELIQEALVEAHAGKASLWELLLTPAFKEKGRSTADIAGIFDGQSAAAKGFAYGLAEEIKKELDAAELDSINNASDDEDRQGSFVYDPCEIRDMAQPPT